MNQNRTPASGRNANHVEFEEHDWRTETVWLTEDDSALDVFASESDLAAVPAPSAAATAHVSVAAETLAIPDQSIEPVRAPAIEIDQDYAIDPVQDHDIDFARYGAIEPVQQYARRHSARTPGTSLVQRCAVFVVLALGVFGGGMAGLYFRRNPLDLAIIRIRASDAADQATIPIPAAEAPSPRADGHVGTTTVTEQPVTSAGGPPVPADDLPASLAPAPVVRTIPDATAASAPTQTPAPPRAANESLSPPPAVVPPVPTPPPSIEPPTTEGSTSASERVDGSEVLPPAQATPAAPP